MQRMKNNTEYEYIAEGQLFHGSVPRVMGTRLEMLFIGASQDQAVMIWDRLLDVVFSLDRRLNRFDAESEVSQLNMYDNPLQMPMSQELESIVALCEQYKEKTCGLFDVVDSQGKLDFGGFGKGYFLMKCNEILRGNGIHCAFVDFGSSSILGVGHHPYGDSWQVGVVNPFTHRTMATLDICDKSLSTSGNTPSYDGHIRNPHTGEVCSGNRLVSVISENPLDAEVLSTTLMIADEQQRDIIQKNFPDADIRLF